MKYDEEVFDVVIVLRRQVLLSVPYLVGSMSCLMSGRRARVRTFPALAAYVFMLGLAAARRSSE